MENGFSTYKRVGYFRDKMAEFLGVECTGTIYASPGVVKHIKNRHGNHLSKKTINNIIEIMKAIIDEPDYVGIYSLGDDEILIELVKKIDTSILLGIQISKNVEYIYVSTMYPITDGKIDSKLYSGKLVKWNAG